MLGGTVFFIQLLFQLIDFLADLKGRVVELQVFPIPLLLGHVRFGEVQIFALLVDPLGENRPAVMLEREQPIRVALQIVLVDILRGVGSGLVHHRVAHVEKLLVGVAEFAVFIPFPRQNSVYIARQSLTIQTVAVTAF